MKKKPKMRVRLPLPPKAPKIEKDEKKESSRASSREFRKRKRGIVADDPRTS